MLGPRRVRLLYQAGKQPAGRWGGKRLQVATAFVGLSLHRETRNLVRVLAPLRWLLWGGAGTLGRTVVAIGDDPSRLEAGTTAARLTGVFGHRVLGFWLASRRSSIALILLFGAAVT